MTEPNLLTRCRAVLARMHTTPVIPESSVDADVLNVLCFLGLIWKATPSELAQAKRADAAYAKVRDADFEAKREAAAVAGLPAKLREVNRRLLAHRDVKPDNIEQLDLLAPRSA